MNAIMFKILKRKKRSQRDKLEATVDSSSIGDMAFLLLIFFIVTSSFILRQGIFHSLPPKDATSVKKDEKYFFEITPLQNEFVHKGRAIKRTEFKRLLKEHRDKVKKPILVIWMGQKVKYDRLVDTLSVVEELGGGKAGFSVSLKNM